MAINTRNIRKSITKLTITVLLGTSLTVQGATYTTLINLAGVQGQAPRGQLVQGRDGNLYGVTSPGTVVANAFRITQAGNYKVIHSFNPVAGGLAPTPSPLMLGADGNFYGITTNGSNSLGGMLFKMTPAGAVTSLHQFGSVESDGYSKDNGILRPNPPVQMPDGTLFGTTTSGGQNGVGTVYKYTPQGEYSIIHHFVYGVTDGGEPSAPLVIGNDGNLYGTTTIGGQPTAGSGTVFRIIPATGAVNILYSFNGGVGSGHQPQSPLFKGNDGILYGTAFGRADLDDQGSVFKITAAGVFTRLKAMDFSNNNDVPDGAYPIAGVVQASDGLFYGMNSRGGVPAGVFANDAGVIFSINKQGVYDVSHTFDKAIDGGRPLHGLVQHTNGKLYGATQLSQTGLVPAGNGSIFSFDVGARSYVMAQQNSGKAGDTVGLLGNFVGATGVTFNGVPAVMTGAGNLFRTVTVPEGPATGIIKIIKPTLSVNGITNFFVRPVLTSFSPTNGTVGAEVVLSGKSLSQTTAVVFNSGVSAAFAVLGDDQIRVTVPVGARTGKIRITTKGGSIATTSNFTVTP